MSLNNETKEVKPTNVHILHNAIEMKQKKLNKRKCKSCGKEFQKERPLQYTCSYQCAIKYSAKNSAQANYESNKKQVSKKRSKQLAEYLKIRLKFLSENPYCERCTHKHTTEVHHKAGRTNERLNNIDEFMSVCRDCHNYIHANPIESRENGWLK